MIEKIDVDFKKKNGILKCSPYILKLIREKFSIVNPSYKMRRVVPRLYAITPTGAFQIGLWNDIEHFIRSLNLQLSIEYTKEFTDNFKPILGIDDIAKIDGFTYYDYQEDTIREFIKNGRGISLLSVAAGKSLVSAGLCKTLLDHNPDFKILIIVPNVALLTQLYNSFINEFNVLSITKWGDSFVPDLTQNIIIANSQILISDISKTLAVVENFDAVIVDEVHTINEKKNKISKVIHNIHTPIKFGLTGTLPDSLMANWNVIGKIGPILYERNSFELRKQQTTSEVEIRVVLCQHAHIPKFPKNVNPTDRYVAEMDYLINFDPRNKLIFNLVDKLVGNTLIVVDRLLYVDVLKNVFNNSNKKIFTITGDTPTDDRTVIQNLMEQESGIVLIAMSKCFSVGVSVKNLHYAVFAYVGKSGVKTVQTIGRTVRKHISKDKAVIFDIADNLEYSLAHLRKRLLIYKDQKIEYTINKIKL